MKVAVDTEEGVELILDQAVTMLKDVPSITRGGNSDDYYAGVFDGTVMALECLLSADEEKAYLILEQALSRS